MKNIPTDKEAISERQYDDLLATLKARFKKYQSRHLDCEWDKVEARLTSLNNNLGKLWSLSEMERTGGEPDVVGYDRVTKQYSFFDCSVESPAGRGSLCYDREALNSRKEHQPQTSVMDMASAMGIELLTEAQYLELQMLGEFDRKTSSWVKTPAAIRKLGGALYGESRYGRIFLGHNGAQSYYKVRGFRGSLRI